MAPLCMECPWIYFLKPSASLWMHSQSIFWKTSSHPSAGPNDCPVLCHRMSLSDLEFTPYLDQVRPSLPPFMVSARHRQGLRVALQNDSGFLQNQCLYGRHQTPTPSCGYPLMTSHNQRQIRSVGASLYWTI